MKKVLIITTILISGCFAPAIEPVRHPVYWNHENEHFEHEDGRPIDGLNHRFDDDHRR